MDYHLYKEIQDFPNLQSLPVRIVNYSVNAIDNINGQEMVWQDVSVFTSPTERYVKFERCPIVRGNAVIWFDCKISFCRSCKSPISAGMLQCQNNIIYQI